MADIEKMYFQIFVVVQRRSLLRFLWWKKGNISDKPIDYEMCVHVFGGVSFGACSNHTLKITIIENKEKFDEEAAQALQNNFFVDNLLKSVENEDMLVQLIKKVTGMCHEGDFNLTKFTSNNKEFRNQSQRKTDNQLLRTYILYEIFHRIKCWVYSEILKMYLALNLHSKANQ